MTTSFQLSNVPTYCFADELPDGLQFRLSGNVAFIANFRKFR
jgi:hypothetical protein